jgi:hypothetical protein
VRDAGQQQQRAREDRGDQSDAREDSPDGHALAVYQAGHG